MSRDAWERAYTDGLHEQQWDTPWSSPELAGFLTGVGELPGTALDLGCGTGGDAVYLAERGIETIGLDISPTALEIARKRAARSGVQVTWVEGDVLELPFPDGSIDLVTDRGCLHHITLEDQGRYANEVARILTPGGRLLIREMNEAGRHKHAVTEDSIRSMISGLPLRVALIVPFEMLGPHGSAHATLAMIQRT